ncbi:hypothetical protein SAMN05428969_2576 [Devosia sp. YR412]|uniref:hypothetical protein n=1 Tax=Devosia sp. YR412 TaxID=1881030 RepID=UPI0008B3539C|nr:hypothetical protein [Devosia sp. YR412]SEQ29029.1 hypothetical protein SAMN05428969_2576 [Devosia sp. YR412]
MSNALGIGPNVMINRLVDQSGTPQDASLGKVAELRGELLQALDERRAEAERVTPEGEVPALSSGAVVDRLI